MATLFGIYIPAPYLPATTGSGGTDGLVAAGVILLIVVVTAAAVLMSRPSRRTKARELPTELPKAA